MALKVLEESVSNRLNLANNEMNICQESGIKRMSVLRQSAGILSAMHDNQVSLKFKRKKAAK